MKKITRLLASVFLVAALGVLIPLATTSCSTPPSARVAQVQTLKAVGQSAEAAVSSSAQLYAAGTITADQARQVMDTYNLRFQPVYRVAVNAVNSNLESVASPDLVAIAAQLSALVLQFSTPTPH